MATSVVKDQPELKAIDVHFDGDWLSIVLSDDRRVSVPMSRIPWLNWLAKATAQQQAKWSIEPSGFAVYWNDLDDGIEVKHLLDLAPLH